MFIVCFFNVDSQNILLQLAIIYNCLHRKTKACVVCRSPFRIKIYKEGRRNKNPDQRSPPPPHPQAGLKKQLATNRHTSVSTDTNKKACMNHVCLDIMHNDVFLLVSKHRFHVRCMREVFGPSTESSLSSCSADIARGISRCYVVGEGMTTNLPLLSVSSLHLNVPPPHG